MKVLITDGMTKEGLTILESAEGLDLDVRKSTSKEELAGIIGGYDAIIIRSATKLTADLIEAGKNLRVIGRAGIGVDNVDVEAATKKGIVVMNTPEANAITTAEHTITLMLSLARQIPQAHASLKSGKWERNKFRGIEIYGKTLGCIGLGNIGKLVAERAIGLKMNVIAYDPFLSKEAAERTGVELVTLDDLLKRSDIITIHTPLNSETKNLINKDTLEKTKKGLVLINCARGGVINEKDISEAIKSGRVAGAAFDVFINEPPEEGNPLLALEDNVVFTPHLGASTEEAQTKVGVAIADQIVDFLNNGVVKNAVNMPSVSLEVLKTMKPYLNLAEKLGSLQGQLCKGGVKEIHIEYDGEVSELDTSPLTVAALKGFLTPMMDVVVSHVNAPVIAEERGIKVIESKSSQTKDYTSLISIKVKTEDGESHVSGTIFGKEEPRFVRINGVTIDVVPKGYLLVSENNDRPGFIGAMCTLLGENGVNIGLLHLGREAIGGRAIVFTNVDSPVPAKVIDKISKLPDIISVTQVKL
ncbi:MAG: phosphoglycerate dehydrogenase [Candidatus Dadabacteria bacterium RIFCSPHIGHO2_12_FULL_53_21]|nr:MAG: phosphoglycerate dehydrogenase [Candidatus Dadabacteria bacterium RIFCSPHIGHO2_12_FULL_53_21]